MPDLATRYPTHQAFGKADVPGIIEPWGASRFIEASELASTVFLNRNGRFEARALPKEAQLAPVFSINSADFDADGIEDLFLSQNFFGTATDLTRDDAGRGLWLRGKGDGTFQAVDASESGIRVEGEQRGAALGDFNHDGRVDLAVTQNLGPGRVFINRSPQRGIRVELKGRKANPEAVGALLRVVYPGDRMGPARNVAAGAGYWSQDAAVQVLGTSEKPTAIWIRWPDGRCQTVPVREGDWDIRVVQIE